MNYSYSYIEQKAEEVLMENDFFHIGFDVKKFAKKLKIEVLPKELDDDVAGLFVRINGRPVISYNQNQKNKSRERFTIAHELGHFFLHSNKNIFIDKNPKVMFRNTASSSGEQLQEKEANHFAAALLMPRKLIKTEIDNIPINTSNPIKYLSVKFNVSEQAMTFRLANLGYDIGLY
jgi:Zn-dependent peptidase ImmA (M78 family)